MEKNIKEDIGNNIAEEMQLPEKELGKTLPIKKGELPKEEDKPDYLNDFDSKNSEYQQPNSAPVMFGDDTKDTNIIFWQLRVDWDRIEHVLRGHKPKVDAKGNEYFTRIDDHYLNDYGVNMVLHFLSGYLSKEIFLARYKQEKADIILSQFSRKFTHFFYDNIVEFGMDTPKKKKVAPMFVQMVIDLVDASYSRAIGGKTSDLINKQYMVSQNQPLDRPFNPLEVGGANNQKKNFVQKIFS